MAHDEAMEYVELDNALRKGKNPLTPGKKVVRPRG